MLKSRSRISNLRIDSARDTAALADSLYEASLTKIIKDIADVTLLVGDLGGHLGRANGTDS